MQAILRDLGIEEFIEENSAPPVAKTPPTEADIRLQKEWKTGDAKAQTWIKLAIGDAEMIHISSATMAREMWKQLTMVKESRGHLQRAKHCIELQLMSHLKWLITFLNYKNYRRSYISWEAEYQMKIL